MKFSRILASAVAAAFISTTAAFAAPDIINSTKNQEINVEKYEIKKDRQRYDHLRPGKFEDPVKALESRKEKFKSLLKEGKITKEEADKINTRIDAKIKKIKEFNKLSPDQKKDKLRNGFKEAMDQKVKDGKITKEKADELIKDFNEKVQKWDGKGYPGFFGKEFGFKRHHDINKKIDKAAQ